MGSLFRSKYATSGMTWAEAKASGQLRESDVWWMKYRDAGGRLVRASTETHNRREAERVLKRKEGAAVEGRHIPKNAERITNGELAKNLQDEYKANERKSADRLSLSLAHLLPVFGPVRAVHVTKADVDRYAASRKAEGAANGTINRELSALRRVYALALDAELIHRAPRFKKLDENNVRQGFFERDQFEAVRKYLADYLQPVVTFEYITGWRSRREVLPLQWRQVDFKAGTVRLEPGTTKNDEGRTFVMTPELRGCLEAQKVPTDALQKKTGRIIPWVFHRNGKPLRSFYKAWRTACRKAGVPGRICHDFRRTAVKNMTRAGIPERVAMLMSGHKTRDVFDRYDIVSERDLRDAAAKLAAAVHA